MQINLTWSPSTDNVGVTAYLLERCAGAACTGFVQIASQSSLSYVDTDVTPGATYRYRVRARDAAGNLSAYSAIATAVATSIPPPSGQPDFHLQPSSPACRAGVFLAEVQFDRDGRTRPNPPSAGAHEGNC